jgi:hypothetical protein
MTFNNSLTIAGAMGSGFHPWIQGGLSTAPSDKESLLCPGMESIPDRSELKSMDSISRDGFNPESLGADGYG